MININKYFKNGNGAKKSHKKISFFISINSYNTKHLNAHESFFHIHISQNNYPWDNLVFYIIFILFNSTKLENFNSFIRNSYSIIAYSYCYSITIEFWLILFCGLAFGKNPFAGKKVVTRAIFLEALYLHLGITIVMVIDLILNERKIEKNKNNKILLVINLIYFCYSIVVLCANYVFFMPAYPFMENAGAGLMILIFVISFVLINSCFYIHLFLVRKLYGEKQIQKKNI